MASSTPYVVGSNIPLIGPSRGPVGATYDPRSGVLTYNQGQTGISECELGPVGTDLTLGVGSFLFGLIIGIIIVLIIFLLLFVFRALFFSDVPAPTVRTCTTNDYYNDPGPALAHTNLRASEILFVNDGKLFYKRVPRLNTSCFPGDDQTINIPFPQYCLFERTVPQNRTVTSEQNVTNITGTNLIATRTSPSVEGVIDLTRGVNNQVRGVNNQVRGVNNQVRGVNNQVERKLGSVIPPDGECNIRLGVGRTEGNPPQNVEAEYIVKPWNSSVLASVDCFPISGAESGIPLPRWDSA